MSDQGTEEHRHHWKLTAMIIVVIVIATGIGAFVTYHAISVKSHRATSLAGISYPSDFKDGFIVLGTLESVNPETKSARIHLTFEPVGRFADKIVLKSPVSFAVFGGTQEVSPLSNRVDDTYSFASGQYMSDIEVTVPLDGSELYYPNDHYDTNFAVQSDTPNTVVVDDGVGDWNLSTTPYTSQDVPAHTRAFALRITRAGETQLYSIFMMGLLWALALAGVAMAFTLIRLKRHKIDSGPLTYLAALLFAFPLIRESLPGDPALGVFADFVGFFWVEVIVGVTLLVLLITWIVRERQPDTVERSGSAFQ